MEELKREVRLLRAAVDGLRDDIARNYAPRAEQIAQRRRLLAVVVVMLLLLAGGGYVTERVTLSHEHRIVASCFLTGQAGVQAARCDREFPGYQNMRAQNADLLGQFQDLQRRVRQLETASR
jgi:hypothetical protein